MVNKITTPPTQNEVIDKINELVDGKQDTITSSNKLSASLVSGLATVATSGNYNDLSNKPTIPTVNNATLTIQKNGSNVATFTANASSNVTANISVPNVTSIYTPAGTDAVNGVAVSNAIATKQDNLVSGTNIKTINGNSLLGSGNIVIETSSTPNVDGETISYNASDALQTIAVKNVRDNSTLPIWHGTEYQWNHGDPTTWYYWQTSVTALWTSGGTLPNGQISLAYGNGRFVAVPESNNNAIYSTDNGSTWNTGGAIPNDGSKDVACDGNNRFIAIPIVGTNFAYSTDGGETWTATSYITSRKYWAEIAYGNGRFVALATDGTGAYSTDGGETWTTVTVSTSAINSWKCIAYGNGRFVALATDDTGAYSTDGGETWTTVTTGGSSIYSICYGNGKFIAASASADWENRCVYSTDGGETWTRFIIPNPSSGNERCIRFGNSTFVVITQNSKSSYYSIDGGETWTNSIMPTSSKWRSAFIYGNGIFLALSSNSTDSAIFTVQYDKCYTDTANPTTASVVYSEPETTSSYTISSVTSGAITLSNNNTYYYNQSGNQYTYQTIGDAHPEYLCFIDGVGVKIGNTTIATNNSNNS